MVKDMSIGEIVANDFRTAALFKEAGIDFCCGGKKDLSTACSEKGIDEASLIRKLDELESTPADLAHNYKEWEPGFLCDYIVNTHHKYVQKTLPELGFYTSKIASVHGERHRELVEVESLFTAVKAELSQHLRSEEEIFFPAIKEFLSTRSERSRAVLKEQLVKLSAEHESAGGAMDKINVITDGYRIPADGCNTYQVTFRMLEQFEDDLHVHVHLENNILFPRIISEINQ